MQVVFRRTGARRYAVIIRVEGLPEQGLDPAPGYDNDIPHDLVHYMVEAELGMQAGVYGRAAKGGGTFIRAAADGVSARGRARQQRKQRRREQSLGAHDRRQQELIESERLAGICDVYFRRAHGQRPDPARPFRDELLRGDAVRVARVVERLTQVAPLWRALSLHAELTFDWPSSTPLVHE